MSIGGPEAVSGIFRALQEAVGWIAPAGAGPSGDPGRQARRVARAASLKAAACSGTLALPPGPAGLLTILPDLLLVWRLQGQMVSDIAALYGKTAVLTREGMIHCLFKHAAVHALAGIVVRTAGGLLIRRATAGFLQAALGKVGLALSERLATRAVSRWLPVVGAAGAGAYAYYDTTRVARTAIEVFASDVRLEEASQETA
jgi:hypothetical protein